MGKYDNKNRPFDYHRYIDEAGDMSFFGKGGVPLEGLEGVSKSFMLGMVKYKSSLKEIRQILTDFMKSIEQDPYFNSFPSVKKRINSGGYYLHAKDDPPELRYKFFELMRSNIDFTIQVVVGRKDVTRFVNKHNKNETEFYADLLTRILTDKANYPKLVLNIAYRGSSTRMQNLQDAALKAKQTYEKIHPGNEYNVKMNFNVQPYTNEPLLSVADYGLWAIQRLFEKGETRFYDSIMPKVRFVEDIYDPINKRFKTHCYGPKNPLTENNKL
jgi:hypothetical protein